MEVGQALRGPDGPHTPATNPAFTKSRRFIESSFPPSIPHKPLKAKKRSMHSAAKPQPK